MRQHLKAMQKRKKHLTMLLFLAPRLNSRAFANNKASSGTTSSRLNLQHEPIQPMPPAEDLTPAKVTLGDADAVSDDEKEGYHRFKTYGCIVRHQGSNVAGNLFMKIGVSGNSSPGRREQTKADQGRFNVTGDKTNRYVFRVPSLRLTALTSPYFHDASVKTLKQAVKTIARHQLDREPPNQDLTCIVKFLKTLPGEYKGQPLCKEHKPQKTNKKP